MKLTKELIIIIDDSIDMIEKGKKSGLIEGQELTYFETAEIGFDEDPSEGTYTTNIIVVEKETDEIIRIDVLENRYSLQSEDYDYELDDSEVVEQGWYKLDGTEMILDESKKFIPLEEFVNN